MKRTKSFRLIMAAGVAALVAGLAAPAAHAATANAFVVSQTCINGDFVSVKLSATVQPNQPARYRWDFNNDGVFDTAFSTSPTVTHRYPDERRITARVLVVTASGARATDTVTFTTKRCGGGGGNDG